MNTLRTQYLVGFVFSLMTTLAAYDVALLYARMPTPAKGMAMVLLLMLALAQFVIQAMFFLHLSMRPKQKERLYIFVYASALIVMLVMGSLWIMTHLNERMMEPSHMSEYMQLQTGI